MKQLLITLAVCGMLLYAGPVLAANGTISGTITHTSGGTPVSTVWVNVVGVDDPTGGTAGYTAADGTYSLSVAPGTYVVYPSTGTSTEPNITFIKKSLIVTVADGEAKSGQNIAVTRRGRFTGHVYASDGVTPISGATVTITHASGFTSGYGYSQTLTNGGYTSTPSPSDITTSATGMYSFSVSRAGYFTRSITGVNLGADEVDVTQNITLTAQSTISGTVRDANGAAIAGASLILAKSGGSSYTAMSDASGNYVISVFDPYSSNGTAVADYTLAASKVGFIGQSSSISITADGSALTAQNFTLPTGIVFSGTIKAKTGGTALTNAVVSLYKRNKTRSTLPDSSFTTSSDGTFLFNTLTPGKYRVTISRTGYATIEVESITLTSNKTGMVYKLETAGSIGGTLTTGKSVPVDGVSVWVYALKNGKTAPYTSVTSDSSGVYLIPSLKKGTYKLVFSSTDYVLQTVTITVKNTTKITKNIKLSIGGSVSGYLMDKDTGLPLSSSMVRVAGSAIAAWSDSNGYYVLDGIAPGQRKIVVNNYLYDSPKSVTVTVKAGKVKAGVNFALNQKQ